MMKRATHSLLLAVVASAMLLPVVASGHAPIGERQVTQISVTGSPSSTSSPESSTAAHTTTTAAATSAAVTSSSSSTPAQSPSATSATPSSATNVATTHAASATAPSTAQAVGTTVVPTTTTDSSGNIITSYIVQSVTPTPSAVPSQTGTSDNSDGGGLSTGSVIGLSVAGAIAALGIVLFFVWKCTRKQFADFDGDEAIKWPELNAHNSDVHALPTNSTGRAGFGLENDSDANLTRAPSPGGTYANSIAASSVPEMYGAGDPYAVPPLPHLNPNQPYRDEPGTYGQPATFYDPYRGPVPNTFADPISGNDAESIPMTQMARTRSPGPQMGYDMQGRGSPAPQAAMGYAGMDDRSRTPIPGALGATGRASPSPHPGYGHGP